MDWTAIALAIVGSIGVDRLIVYMLERRARGRQANAQADKAQAEVKRVEAAAGKTEAESEMIRAEAEGKSLDNAFRMINALTLQLSLQEGRLAEHEKRVTKLMKLVSQYARRLEYLMSGIRTLLVQMERACLEPEWSPVDFVIEEDGL